MLTIFPTAHTDYDRMLELLSWCSELQSSYAGHSALIVGSQTLSEEQIRTLVSSVKRCGFDHATAIKLRDEDNRGWPWAPGEMFRTTCECVAQNQRCAFYWLESDAIPIQSGWLDAIQSEYVQSRKAFLGAVYDHPYRHLNGSCVYPSNVRRHNPYIFNSEFFGAPWDVVKPEITLRNAHVTRLIVRALADPAHNEPFTFPDAASVAGIIPDGCAVFHGNKDGTLIARLREARNHQPQPEERPSLAERVVNGVKKLISGETRYLHAGNLGDVIYSLPAIKAAGGGEIVICPDQRKTAVCAVPIDRKQFEMLEPLLKAQPYLKGVSFSQRYPGGARDLNHFRTLWNTPTLRKKHNVETLRACHFLELGILHKMDEEPWIEGVKPIPTGKIIVGRSPRYQAPAAGPQSFPWQRIVDKHKEDLIFVGLESEHEAFCRTFGAKVSFWRVKEFAELASLIAGGRCFVGNQSFCLSVAIGLGQTVYCEACPRSPDVRVNRPSYKDQLQGGIEL